LRHPDLVAGPTIMDDDDLVLWQDVLDDVANGKISNLKCPFCQKGEVKVSLPDATRQMTRLECTACRKFIEGKMQTD
jgi:hypothetical protein